MANNQDCPMENGEDFSQDVTADQNFGQNQGDVNDQNGPGDAPPADSGSANDRRLFVGGLSSKTTDKELRDHFGQYGETESINVQMGRTTGIAFIVFNNAEAIDKVVAAGEHVINNKKVNAAKAKGRCGKIYVGGLTNELSADDIENYFGQYGTIIKVKMAFNKKKTQRKDWCIIIFESEQVANELLTTPKRTIKDKEVEVKKYISKADAMNSMPGRSRTMSSGRGGTRGRGRGGYGQGYGGGSGGYQGGKQRGGDGRNQRLQPY